MSGVQQLADADARGAALDLDSHILAVAPAGSGKTSLLVQRMLAALATVNEPEQVVAVTFTNKAAAEIRARVMLALQSAMQAPPIEPHKLAEYELAHAVLLRALERGWDLTANPERLRALTLDGLQAQIAAELPLLSGLGARPRVVDDAQPLYEQALLSLFAQVEDASATEELRNAASLWLRSAGNRIDRLLPPFTQLLARREQWSRAIDPAFDWAAHENQMLDTLHVEHQQQLLDALGPGDAAELVALAREAAANHELLAWASGLNQWPQTGAQNVELHRRLAGLLVTKEGELRKPGGIKVTMGFVAKTPATQRLKQVLTDRAGDDALVAAAANLQALPPPRMSIELAALRDALLVLLRHALAHLKLVMGERGEADFVEIAEGAQRALRPEGGYGDALLHRDAQLRHLLVDEMQDTSGSQLDLLQQLTAGWQPGDGRSLFLVGDPQQSIYAFRKADVKLFQKMFRERRLGELHLRCVLLQTNFRSDGALVEWFNQAFASIFPQQPDEFSGAVLYTPSVASKPSSVAPVVALHGYAENDTAGEAEDAARRAAALAASGGSVAILVRARSHVAATLAALRRLGVRATCQDVDALATLPGVRELLATARALWHPEDRLSWAILLRAPFVGLSWADLIALSRGHSDRSWPQRLAQAESAALSAEGFERIARLNAALALSLEDARRGLDLPDRTEKFWLTLGGPAGVGASELADIRRALRLMREQLRGSGLEDTRAFDRSVEQLYAAPSQGSVQVMTVHKAKGLEFDYVLLVGAGRRPRGGDKPLLHLVETRQGVLLVPKPPAHWSDAEAKASSELFDYVHELHQQERRNETLRLLYVAVTRARRTLDIYYCAASDAQAQVKAAADSFARWLAPVLPLHQPAPVLMDVLDAPQLLLPPRAPRLRLPFELPAEESGLYYPREQRSLRPSEAVLSAVETKRDEGDVYAQLVGTLVHQALAKVAGEGVARWADNGVSRATSLAAGFRRLGMPEPEVDRAVARVLELIARTLASDTGRWLLAPHPWAQSEYALAGYREGRWISAVIDRCFEDAQGQLWVIDYKAAARPIAAAALDDYVAAGIERYREQLREYASLLSQLRAQPVKSALYFVEADRLVNLE